MRFYIFNKDLLQEFYPEKGLNSPNLHFHSTLERKTSGKNKKYPEKKFYGETFYVYGIFMLECERVGSMTYMFTGV